MDITTALPDVVDRSTWLLQREQLLVREKAHTREGDAIAAARRRLPMTPVDAQATLQGPDGPTTLLDVFAGRDQLIAYKHMWHRGHTIAGQCMGCTASVWSIQDAAYLNHRGVSFAVFCEGPWDEVGPYVTHMGYQVPWYSAHDTEDDVVAGGLSDTRGLISCYLRVGDAVFLTNETTRRGVEAVMAQARLLDMSVYGRQEEWEESPAGWPQHPTGTWWQEDGGRPVPQRLRTRPS